MLAAGLVLACLLVLLLLAVAASVARRVLRVRGEIAAVQAGLTMSTLQAAYVKRNLPEVPKSRAERRAIDRRDKKRHRKAAELARRVARRRK